MVAGTAVVAAIVTVQIATNLVDYGVYDYRFALVNPNREGSLFAWISAAGIACAACVCLFQGLRTGSERLHYLVLGPLLVFIAIENRVRSHEQAVHDPLVFVPLFGALSVGLLWVSRRWPAGARHVLWAGLAALVFSLGLRRLAPHLLLHYGYGPGSWPYEVKVSLKESGELCGWTLVATGLLAAARGESVPERRRSRQ